VVHSTPTTLFSGAIDGTGGLAATVTLPALAQGSHELVVTASTQEKSIWFAVNSAGIISAVSTTGPVTDPTIVPAATGDSAATGDLATTGVDPAGQLYLATGLLLAGMIACAFVFMGRRRQEG
jgi:hypothetical protein